jgi:imidazolonepropionase-like amidohydrolase
MMRRTPCATRRLVLAAVWALAAAPLAGQTVAIVGGTVYPVSGPKIEHATVLLRDGRIAAVGANVPIPPGATTIDATGKWVTPGLVNAVTSLGVLEIEQVNDTRDFTPRGKDAIAAAFAVIDGLNPASPLIPPAREAGVTTVAIVPTGGLVAGQAAMIDLVPGPPAGMVVKAPLAMVAQVGNAGDAGTGARGELVARLRTLFDDVRLYERRHADYERASTRPLSASAADLAALVPVLHGREPLLVRADRASDIETAVSLAHEYGLKLIIAGGAEAWQVAGVLAAAKVPVLTGSLNNLPSNFSRLGQRQDNAALLRRAGVSVVLIGNSDEEDESPFNVRNIAQDAGTAVAYGLPWEEALRAVTLAPAEAFGLADRLGALRPGLEANVVVWSGDPFELNTHAEHVYVRGREYRGPSRQDELTERYKSLPPNYRR